ncbi:MAG: hypothetical protein RLZZ328_1403 [Bacteroidota bacterium]|jgi:hypothetical protein
MIVGVQGSSSFDDYQVFLRAMGVALSGISEEDRYFYIYSAGPANVNAMCTEFVNVSERSLKSRGIKIKMYKVPPSWIDENINTVNYFAYLCKPNEKSSRLVGQAELNNIEVGIFKY